MPVRQPNPRHLPVSIRVWFFPQAAPTTLWSFRDSITVGKSRRFVSPTPSCPFSLRPSEVIHSLILKCLHNWKLGLESMQISSSLNIQYTWFILLQHYSEGPGVAQWLRHCATSRTVPGSIPGGVTGDFFRGSPRQNHAPWGRLSLWKWVPGISPVVKAAGAYGWWPTTLVVPNIKKIRGLNLPGTPLGHLGLLQNDLYLYLYKTTVTIWTCNTDVKKKEIKLHYCII